MGKKYLIYVDILGFENLPTEISKRRGLEPRKIRSDFVNVIEERVEALEAKGKIIGKKYGESDDWLLVTDDLCKVFSSIFEILNHNTGYKGYERIPLEIGIGTGEYDRWAKFEGKHLTYENETIKLLKTYLINCYHKWYKKEFDKEAVESTFVVLTESAYNELPPLDKKICQKVDLKCEKNIEQRRVVTLFVADVSQVQRKGRVLEFLEKIGLAGSRLYDMIDDLYIPPREYAEIREALEKDRIVFITGTAEYGKTYTAVRLLWEYSTKNYEPKWILGGEERERMEVRKRLEDIGRELKERHIVYFEDPFGKIAYEKREGLEREIETIIDSVKKVDDVYVIITSREEVFKEFEEEKLSLIELKKFEKKLNIKKPSYDYEKRKEILLKWAEAKDCKWLKDKSLKNVILKCITDKRYLPTPLSIRDFVLSSLDLTKEKKLIEKMEEKSKETSRSFAKEIENMNPDRILFLSFAFLDDLRISFCRTEYKRLTNELNIRDSCEFDEILNWFKGDKITVRELRISFSHPSYSEALEHLLIDKNSRPTRINKDIFSRVLLSLSGKHESAKQVARAVHKRLDKFPEKVRDELVLRLSEDTEAASYIAWDIALNFDEFSEKRGGLVFKLLGNNGSAFCLVEAIHRGIALKKIPDKLRDELLLKLLERGDADGSLVFFVLKYYRKLPENVRDPLLKLFEKEWLSLYIAFGVEGYFDTLPKKVRNELLLRLSKKRDMVERVEMILARNHDKIPEKVKTELLINLKRTAELGPHPNICC